MRTRPPLVLIVLTVVLALGLFAPAALAAPRDAAVESLAALAIQQAELTAGDGAAGDRFGYSVALFGDTALVGAAYKPVGTNDQQGAAYVFTRSGAIWTQQQQLTASDGATGDRFGSSVALSGDTALVGASLKTSGANVYQGVAYVFTRTAGVWTQQQKLTASDGVAYDLFGGSVALSGDTALVGARRKTVDGNIYQGAAYVFTRSATVWTQQQKLTASDGAVRDAFGLAVALSGDTALVGAPDKTVGGNFGQGAAYVFTRTAGVWTQQQLTASDSAEGDQFGDAVALSGDTALVGAYGKRRGANPYQGAAYVFTRTAGVWTQQQQLTASGGAYDLVGSSVALSGDTALVGASFMTVGTNDSQGAACVFTRSAGVWTQRQKLTASDAAAGDGFGDAVALSGDTALVGASYKTVGTNVEQGAAYVFAPWLGHAIGAAAGPHGTITPSGRTAVPLGGSQSYTITPERGYHVAEVRVDGRSVGALTSYTFTNVTRDHAISATFAIDTYALTSLVGTAGHGCVTPAGTQTVTYGATPTFIFSPDRGYYASRLTIDGVAVAFSAPNRYTFAPVTGRHTLQVFFTTAPRQALR